MRSVDTQTPSGMFSLSTADRQFPRILGVGGFDDDSSASTLPIIPGGEYEEDSLSPEPEDGDMAVDGKSINDAVGCFSEASPSVALTVGGPVRSATAMRRNGRK